MLELDQDLAFDPASEEEFFSLLAAGPAVCLIQPRDTKAEPYLIRTADLRRRLQRLLGPPAAADKRLNLRDFAAGIRYRATGSSFEQAVVYYVHARRIFPGRYREMMRLKPPAVLKVNLRNAYPRCYVTRRIPVGAGGEPVGGVYYGPFASRRTAAEFAENALDFFKVRRCQIKIRRDPAFPGCLYSEMKMCLAPCFAGCSKEEYDVEVGRLVQFLESGGDSLRAELERERDLASSQMEFERAASLHKRLEKLDRALRMRSDLTRRIPELAAVILQKAAAARTVAMYVLAEGKLNEPVQLDFSDSSPEPRSAEEMVRRGLEQRAPLPDADLSEHLALVARWFYRAPREGEILFQTSDWPYRRILRACSRLLAEPAGGH